MKKISLAALAAISSLAIGASAAGAAPQSVDSYCSPTGDFCQEILRTKNGAIKFSLASLAFSGKYEVCVRGPKGKNCATGMLKITSDGAYVDKISWNREFPIGPGGYKVVWKLGGTKIGKTLQFGSDL